MDIQVTLPTPPIRRPRKMITAQVVVPGEVIATEPGLMR